MSQTNQTLIFSPEITRVATMYAVELAAGREGVSPEPKEYHYRFAEAVTTKNAYALEHLANGLNDKGKKVFSQVTGIALPRTQQGTWAALMAWAGINPLQDTVIRMKGNAEREKRFLKEKNVEVSDRIYQEVNEKIKDGFREIRSISGNRMLTNGVAGINLSKRGTGMHHLVDYINAQIKYRIALEALEAGSYASEQLSKAA